MVMEFIIEIVPEKKENTKKAMLTRLDALQFDEPPDLKTVVAKLQRLVNKWNRSYRVIESMRFDDRQYLHSSLVNLSKFHEYIELKVEALELRDDAVLTHALTSRFEPHSIKVRVTPDFASLVFYRLDEQEGEIFTWSNKILDKSISLVRNKREDVQRLTHRILNALITAYLCKSNKPIREDIHIDTCIKYLTKWSNDEVMGDRKSIISHWKYGMGYVKKQPWAKPVVEQIGKELEV